MNRTALTIAAILVALTAAACQEAPAPAAPPSPRPEAQPQPDPQPEPQPTPAPQPEAEVTPAPEAQPQPEAEVTPDPAPEVEPQPEVAPQPAPEVARITLALSPQQPIYQVGDEVTAQVTAFDAQGAPIEGLTVTTQTSPQLSAGEQAGTWRVAAEGDADITACVGAICQRAALLIDNAPPQLILASPTHATLVSDDLIDTTLEVRGTVIDSHFERLEVFVNGVSASINSSNGAFTAHVPTTPGLNQLTIEAQDGVWPHATTTRADFLYARRFLNSPSEGAQILRGTFSALGLEGAQALESNLQRRWQEGAWRPTGTALLSQPDRYIARAGIAAPGAATARALVDPQRLQLELRVTGCELSLAGFLRYGQRVLNVQGDLSASFLLVATGRWDSATSAWQLDDVTVHVDQLNLTRSGAARAEWPTPDDEHLLRDTVAALLAEQLQRPFTAPTFAQASSALSAPAQVWQDTSIQATGLDGRALGVDLRLTNPRRVGAIELTSTHDVLVTPSVERAGLGVGAILHLGSLTPSTGGELQQGIALEVFNAALLQLWRQGALADEILALDGDDATPLELASYLPPVLVPSAAPAHTLQLQLGAIELRRGHQLLARAAARVDIDLVATPDGAALMAHAPQVTLEHDPALPPALQALLRDRVTDGAALLTDAIAQIDLPAPAASPIWPLATLDADLRGQYLHVTYDANP